MPEATAEPTAEPENKKGFNDYGELLDLTETDGICVLKYKITSSATKKMTVNQNYYTVVNFIKGWRRRPVRRDSILGGCRYAGWQREQGHQLYGVQRPYRKIKAGTVLPTPPPLPPPPPPPPPAPPGKASNRKQEIDRQHYTIPNQRPKDKHCGKI